MLNIGEIMMLEINGTMGKKAELTKTHPTEISIFQENYVNLYVHDCFGHIWRTGTMSDW